MTTDSYVFLDHLRQPRLPGSGRRAIPAPANRPLAESAWSICRWPRALRSLKPWPVPTFTTAVLGLSVHRRGRDGTRLRAAFRTPDRHRRRRRPICRPAAGHETLGVVIPWSDAQFQYTSSTTPARPRGGSSSTVASIASMKNGAYGCLDFGRGIWPYETVWNWASPLGKQDGQIVGLQLGAKWTDGTGMNENALCIGGRFRTSSPISTFCTTVATSVRPGIVAAATPTASICVHSVFRARRQPELGIASTEDPSALRSLRRHRPR